MNTKIFAISTLAFSLFGCSGSARIAELSNDIKGLRAIQADQTAEISQLQEQVRIVTGQVEEIQYKVLGKTKELERTIEQLGSRVPPPAGVPENLLQQDEERIGRIAGESAQLFMSSLKSMRTGSFEDAIAGFKKFIDENPQTAFTDNAYFWTGVAYEKIGSNQDAVAAYSTAFQRFPAEDRAPAALLNLGKLFAKLGSTNDARLALQKVVDDYARSPFAQEAKAELGKLKRR